MSKLLKSPNLLRRETPEALDRRILIAGALAAARHRTARQRHIFGAISGVAAAGAIAAVAIWQMMPDAKPTAVERSASISEQELLELSDWTTLEQENYNLASQLNCYQDIQENGISSQV